MGSMKAKILVFLFAAVPLIAGATVWEGAATVVQTGDLPGGGYAIATNAFPRNSIVDVTNLENDRSVRVLVVSGLDNAGLLATLSQGAAGSIGMGAGSVHRIRITQPSDDIAFAHIRRGPLHNAEETAPAEAADVSVETPETDTDGEAISVLPDPVDAEGIYAETAIAVGTEPDETAGTAMVVGTEPVTEEPEVVAVLSPDDTPEVIGGPFDGAGEEAATAPVARTVMHEPGIYVPNFTLVPYVKRLPPLLPEQQAIPPEHVIPPIEPVTERVAIPPEYIIPPVEPVTERVVEQAPVIATLPRPAEDPVVPYLPYVPAPGLSPYDSRLVTALERGMWYVQLGAFRHMDGVYEISRLGTYPLVVQNIGSEADPVFRVLLGPLNQGESAAVLQRVRSVGHTDAFVRRPSSR